MENVDQHGKARNVVDRDIPEFDMPCDLKHGEGQDKQKRIVIGVPMQDLPREKRKATAQRIGNDNRPDKTEDAHRHDHDIQAETACRTRQVPLAIRNGKIHRNPVNDLGAKKGPLGKRQHKIKTEQSHRKPEQGDFVHSVDDPVQNRMQRIEQQILNLGGSGDIGGAMAPGMTIPGLEFIPGIGF